MGHLLGIALSSRWSTTTVCALCSWAVWQPFSCLVDRSSRTDKMAAMWYLLAVGPRTNLPIKAKAHTLWNGAADYIYICHCPAGLEEKCWVCYFQVAGVCIECWGLCWNIARNGRVQELQQYSISRRRCSHLTLCILLFCTGCGVVRGWRSRSVKVSICDKWMLTFIIRVMC